MSYISHYIKGLNYLLKGFQLSSRKASILLVLLLSRVVLESNYKAFKSGKEKMKEGQERGKAEEPIMLEPKS